jgi:hypothetical protein
MFVSRFHLLPDNPAVLKFICALGYAEKCAANSQVEHQRPNAGNVLDQFAAAPNRIM